MKLWAGRSEKETNSLADELNSSIGIDSRMYRQDIEGSIAHAAMLGAKGIIPAQDSKEIIAALGEILDDIESEKLEIDPEAEDIHTFVEGELTARIGDAGRRLHTARSRNDQVATDTRLYLRAEIKEIKRLTLELIKALTDKAEENTDTIMPGYTHLQRAQPIFFGHHLMAYVFMLMRDVGRLTDAGARMNYNPLGACALAGTTYDIDRRQTAESLGFDGVIMNSLDAVSDRDFCIEIAAACSTLMMHLSRLSEEMILWSSWEFKFIELDDAFTTGSSIMPQKKNSDMAELVRGKTGRVYGDLMTLLTMLKGLPLAYNKDMQEDKEAIFDAVDTVKLALGVFAPMTATMRVLKENMRNAAASGFINATDCADFLVRKGMPFRSAYKITGQLVAECIEKCTTLEELPLEAYQAHSELFDESLYAEIDMEVCAQKRTSLGGTSKQSIIEQISIARKFIDNEQL